MIVAIAHGRRPLHKDGRDLAPDPQDSAGVYTANLFSLFKLETTTALGTPTATIHREPDHNPCTGSRAGY